MGTIQGRPTVSIVIPAYNAESSLGEMLRSVLQQTWRELEIIIVDDGSTDKTASIGNEFAKSDHRVKVISQKRSGVSSARNAGLALCAGKYIRFVDADDTLPAHSVELMVQRAEKDQSDIVIGGYDQYFGNKHRFHNLVALNDTVPFKSIMDHLCSHANSYFYGVLWNKLFLREIVLNQKCVFQENLTWGEDFAFVMDYLCGVDQVSFMEESLYDYRRRPDSTTVRQVVDCVKHPLKNSRIKRLLYEHLQDLYRKQGQYEKYRNRLWVYLFRVGLS